MLTLWNGPSSGKDWDCFASQILDAQAQRAVKGGNDGTDTTNIVVHEDLIDL